MQQNIIPLPQSNTELCTGVIKFKHVEYCIVHASNGLHQSQKAASCLIEPQVGDVVMLCKTGDVSYIIAILQQAQPKTSINLTGDINLSTAGALSIHAAKGLDLHTQGKLSQLCSELQQVSTQHIVTTTDLNVHSQQSKLTTEQAQIHAEQCHSFINRVYQRADQVMRWVETIETAQIGNLVQSVRQTWNARSNNTVITAKQDVKVDAQRIHMG